MRGLSISYFIIFPERERNLILIHTSSEDMNRGSEYYFQEIRFSSIPIEFLHFVKRRLMLASFARLIENRSRGKCEISRKNNSRSPGRSRELFQLHPLRSRRRAVDADCRLSISGSKQAAFDEADAIAFQPSEKHLKRCE